MDASSIAAPDPGVAAEPPPRFPLAARGLAAMLFLTVCALLLVHLEEIESVVVGHAGELVLWTLLTIVINVFHFESESFQFTLDLPLLLAVGALYHPAAAALVALVASIDVRELRGSVSLTRAVFNRCQIALSLFVASTVFQALSSVKDAWPISLLGMAAAFGSFYILNALFVTVLVSLRQDKTWLDVAKGMSIGRPVQFLLTYMGYGVLALVLARMFREVGSWAVVLFLIPILAAHVALVRAEELRALTARLKSRERLLERFSDRIIEERKDERLRIASDLHDDVLQNVTKIWMQARFVAKTAGDDPELIRDVRELVSDADETLVSLRQVISDLKRSPLGRSGLVATLAQLVRDAKLDWGRRVVFKVSGEDFPDLKPEVQLVAYQVAREGLINALKHAQASEIEITLQRLHAALMVCVHDNGLGFRVNDADPSAHFGLGLIQDRVSVMRGTFDISSAPNEGTTLTVTLPLEATTQEPIN